MLEQCVPAFYKETNVQRKEKLHMIGFYDYTVLLTYGGLLCGLYGILQSVHGNFMQVLFCFAGALFCDTMDGKVARAKKNRTPQEQMFGIQIDSLCDVVSFGIAPAVMFFCLGLSHGMDFLFLGFYCLCCVIRLGYFNVLAADAEPGVKNDYHGLPVVCLTVMVPCIYLMSRWLEEYAFLWLLRAALVIFGVLYIRDFTVKKPNLVKLAMMCAVFWIPMAVLMLT